jgi:flagellar hook assembly protein FlgD
MSVEALAILSSCHGWSASIRTLPPSIPPRASVFGVPSPSHVDLSVYDLRGRRVATLVDDEMPAGYHVVVGDGTDHRGRSMASGVYILRLVTTGQAVTRKMLLMQ